LKSAGQTSCSTRLGEYFEGTAGNERPQLAFANVFGSSRKGRQLQIVSIARDDVERPAGGELDQGSKGPVAENPTGEIASAFAGLIDAAKYKAMALVKQRRGTVQSRKVAILWRERGLQVGRVINRVRQV